MYKKYGVYNFPNTENDWITEGKNHFINNGTGNNRKGIVDEERYGIFLFLENKPITDKNGVALEQLKKLMNENVLYIGCSGTYARDEFGEFKFGVQNLFKRIVYGC